MLLVPPDATPQEVDRRRQARFLYWMGWRVSDIAAHAGLPIPTVASWKTRDKWDESPVIERVETVTEARYAQLVCKAVKTGSDYKEIDLLGRQLERFARIRRYQEPGGHEGDLNSLIGIRNVNAAKKRPQKNQFDEEAIERLRQAFHAGLFGYQRTWWANAHQRSRVILKSRQIGATWYFAREALMDAVESGRNQIFLSASKSQAHVFRQYIVAFAKEAGVDLTGDPITLSNGAHLYFLGTNARTAQGYHGNFYFDEFFWTFRFEDLEKVASGMALHKQWRKTYFSTPSSVNHQAYPFWTGDTWNRRRKKDDRQAIDVSWAALQAGVVGPDRKWRHIVTIEDAEREGCDLFDVAELRDEYSPDQFANLLMCEFVDDSLSVFPLALLQPCMVDSWEVWDDFQPLLERPFANRPVWIGYDPSYTGDQAALVLIAPPTHPGGKFRILDKFRFTGMDFAAQAAAIKRLTERFNVTYIGIDATGMGIGVYQLVRKFFPTAAAINYNPEVKTRLVLKAQDTMRRCRLEFDSSWTDVAASFMAIRRTLTGSGRALTYEAGRNEQTGHADLAWAVMHALVNEPLDTPFDGGSRAFMELY